LDGGDPQQVRGTRTDLHYSSPRGAYILACRFIARQVKARQSSPRRVGSVCPPGKRYEKGDCPSFWCLESDVEVRHRLPGRHLTSLLRS
jgi:hypothetical protein